jgi:hypothetical protein
MQTFVDPPTEFVNPGKIQIWKITHNGVDTHPIHFHLFDVQLINRVGWDGFIRLPDANELGWKDTVRISPLEDTIVALRPVIPQVPFVLPESFRPLNPTQPLGSTMGFGQLDPLTGAALEPLQTNVMANFGFEYTWHCHILSHEENDMMRATVFKVIDHIGLFRGNGEWYLDTTGNRAWDQGLDKTLAFGAAGNTPVMGDWDASATAKIGVYSNGTWYLDYNGDGTFTGAPDDRTFNFGSATSIPVTGDWNGGGKTKIGVYDQGTWYLDYNGDGTFTGAPNDRMYFFGSSTSIPVTGDWNGDGRIKIAVYDQGTWYVDYNGDGTFTGAPNDRMYSFGSAASIPVAGDWTGNGTTKIGVVENGTWYLDLNGDGTFTGTDVSFVFGNASDVPVIGKW